MDSRTDGQPATRNLRSASAPVVIDAMDYEVWLDEEADLAERDIAAPIERYEFATDAPYDTTAETLAEISASRNSADGLERYRAYSDSQQKAWDRQQIAQRLRGR